MKHLTYDIIEELPNLSVNLSYTDGKSENLKYVGFFIVDISDNVDIKCHCGDLKDILSNSDLFNIKKFIPNKKNLYIEDYYRLDFDCYIYLFQYIEEDNTKFMIGNLLKKDFETRINLAELYQQWIMRKLRYA